MQVLTKKEAIAKGLKRYYTGKPCLYGHLSERWISNTNCVQCKADKIYVYELSYETKRKYRETTYNKHKDKILSKAKENYVVSRQNPLKRMKRQMINRKSRAKQKDVRWDIDIDTFVKEKGQTHICPVFGVKLDWDYPTPYIKSCVPSLDRLDPNKGYTMENSRIISLRANTLKNNLSVQDIEAIISDIESPRVSSVFIVDTKRQNQMWKTSRKRADKKGFEFNIDQFDIHLPAVCPVLDIPLVYKNKGLKDDSPSVDRIDNTKGYVKGNVRVISHKANRAKSNGSLDEFQKILAYVKRELNVE